MERGAFYRCHLFTFGGPQTEGITSRWTHLGEPVGERVVRTGEWVELLVTLEAGVALPDAPGVRFDILEEDSFIGGGLDDVIVSYATSDAAAADAPDAARLRRVQLVDGELIANGGIADALTAVRARHADAPDTVVAVLRESGAGARTHLVSWWRAAGEDDASGNSEFYFIVRIVGGAEPVEDQSEHTIEVSRERAEDAAATAALTIRVNVRVGEGDGAADPDDIGIAAGILAPDPTLERVPLRRHHMRREGRRSPSAVERRRTTPGRTSPDAGTTGTTTSSAGADDEGPHDAFGPEWPFVHPSRPARDDRIVRDAALPFLQSDGRPDRLVAIFNPWSAALIESADDTAFGVSYHRHAIAYDFARAVRWGYLLFGARSFAVFEGPIVVTTASAEVRAAARARSHYLVAPTTLGITLHGVSGVPAAGGDSRRVFQIAVRYIDALHRRGTEYYVLRAVGTIDDGLLFPPQPVFQAAVLRQLAAAGDLSTVVDRTRAEREVFADIRAAITEGETDRAKALLAQLDHHAFELLTPAGRQAFVELLLLGDTSGPHETAVAELLRAVATREEMTEMVAYLRGRRVGGVSMMSRLVEDLDDKLWGLLTAVGERFADDVRVDRAYLLELFLDTALAGGNPLIPPVVHVRLQNGIVEIEPAGLDELYSAASGFVRFVVGTFEGIWQLVSHPDRIVEGVGQLMQLSLTMELARLGYPPAVRQIDALLAQAAHSAVAAMRGAMVLQVSAETLRRVKWTLIWEILGLFIGAEEIAELANILKRSAAMARLLRVLGLSDRMTVRLTRLAQLLAAERSLGTADDALRLLGHLPVEDVRLLERVLGEIDPARAATIEELLTRAPNAAMRAELTQALERIGPRLEILRRLEAKLGGTVSDGARTGFARLVNGFELDAAGIARLVDDCPAGNAETFLAAIQRLPAREAMGDVARQRTVLTHLSRSPAASRAVLEDGFAVYDVLTRRFGGNLARAEGEIVGFGMARRQTLVAEGEAAATAFVARVAASDAAALRHVRDARRASEIAAGLGDEAADAATRALRAADGAEGAQLQAMEAAMRARGADDAVVALARRRVTTWRTVERLDLPTHVPGMTAAERAAFDTLEVDAWDRLISRADRSAQTWRDAASDAARRGTHSGIKGYVGEELFYGSAEFDAAVTRARARAMAEGLDPNGVRFAREVGDNMRDLGDGLFIVDMPDGRTRILTVIEGKSPGNVRDLAWYTEAGERELGQLENDLARFDTGSTTIDGVVYDADDLVVGGTRSEWLIFGPADHPIPQSVIDFIRTQRAGQIALVPVVGPVADATINAVTTRLLDVLAAAL